MSAPVSTTRPVENTPESRLLSRCGFVAVVAWRTRRGAMQDAERPRSLLRREIERLGEDRRYGTSTSALSSTTSGSFEDDHYRRSYGLRASPPAAATSRRDVDDPDRYSHLYAYGTTSRIPRRSESGLDPSPYASGRDRDRQGDIVPPSSSFPRRARVGAAPSYDAETRRYVGTVGRVTGVRTSASAATVERRVSSTSRAARDSLDEDIRHAPSSSRASHDAGARYVRSGSLGSTRSSIDAFAERRRARLALAEGDAKQNARGIGIGIPRADDAPAFADQTLYRKTEKRVARISQTFDPHAPPRRVAMFDRARGLRGLVNRGNTCFAAACLQSLAHTPPLAEYVLRESFSCGENAANGTNRAASEVAVEFARVVRAIHKSDALASARDAHDPRAFMRALDSRPPLDLFTDGDQHDSQEFLRFLLDALDEALNAVTTPPAYLEEKDDFSEPESAKAARLWAKYRARTSGVVVDVFAGQLRSAVTCHACGKASTSYDPFWDLSLPLRKKRRKEPEDGASSAAAPSSSTTLRRSGSASLLSRYMGVGRSSGSSSGALSVTDCLEAFAEDEPLNGADAFHCPRCEKRGPATKRLCVQRWPRVLVLHLKRFQWNDRGRPGRKIDTAVDVPQTLSLSPYLAEGAATANGGGESKYELFAVINHVGSLAGGHYTATADAGAGEWYAFNDERVSSAGDGPPKSSRNAYVLFYALRR
jgi:ubiquitin C-terminal hydrolase